MGVQHQPIGEANEYRRLSHFPPLQLIPLYTSHNRKRSWLGLAVSSGAAVCETGPWESFHGDVRRCSPPCCWSVRVKPEFVTRTWHGEPRTRGRCWVFGTDFFALPHLPPCPGGYKRPVSLLPLEKTVPWAFFLSRCTWHPLCCKSYSYFPPYRGSVTYPIKFWAMNPAYG